MGDKHRIMVWPISFSIALLGHYHRNGPLGLLGYMQEYARTLLSTLDIYGILCIFLKCGLVCAYAYHVPSLQTNGLIIIRPQKLQFFLYTSHNAHFLTPYSWRMGGLTYWTNVQVYAYETNVWDYHVGLPCWSTVWD